MHRIPFIRIPSRKNTNQYIKYPNVKLNLDRNKSKHAEDVFKQVQDAYDVLKNPSLKATYDASRRLVQTGLPHYQTEKNIDWGAQQIRKESGKKTARNLAIFEQITRPRTLLLPL